MNFIALAVLASQGITVEAGAKPVQDVPVSCVAPGAGPWRLLHDGREVPVQIEDGRAHWFVSGTLKAGAKRTYRLAKQAPFDAPKVEAVDKKSHLILRSGSKQILRYNVATVHPPKKYDQVYARNAFIHPIWTPDGRVISNQFPVHHHLHQNGLWLAWRSSTFEGRKISFWEAKTRTATVEYSATERLTSGPVFGGFRVKHDWIDRSAPGGPKVALKETWDVRAYSAGGDFVFDLVSTQTCATDKPIVNTKVHYGGLAYRGPADWEGKGTMDYLTSEGKTRADGNATRTRWVVARGKVAGREAQIGFLSHPSNFRAPQPVRLHPNMPYFCFAPSQIADFTIEPGKPFVSRYRIIVRDGKLGADEMNRRWNGFAEPPSVRIAD